jgi:pimeloyl-ACP methyl ester carboxylesterase
MAVPPHRVVGAHPDVVVLLHGVGVDARSFDRLVHLLAERHTVVVPDRRGYGAARDVDPGLRLDDHVDDLDELVGSRAPGASIVGVSGGATIALALALRRVADGRADDLGDVVVHEPLLGPLAPELAERVVAGYDRTLARDPTSASRYVRELVGATTWSRLSNEDIGRLATAAWVVAAEVPGFLAFAPERPAIESLRGIRLTTTVGATSPAPRADAAAVLQEVAGACVRVVAGAGHLPQIDAPRRFATVLAECVRGAPV